MEKAKKVVKNTGFLYARMTTNVFISLYSTSLILAALGATDFDVFNLMGSIIVKLSFLDFSVTVLF